MIDPKIAAGEAAQQIVNQCLFNGGMDPETAKSLIPTISAIVVTAITRCVCAPSQGSSDK